MSRHFWRLISSDPVAVACRLIVKLVCFAGKVSAIGLSPKRLRAPTQLFRFDKPLGPVWRAGLLSKKKGSHPSLAWLRDQRFAGQWLLKNLNVTDAVQSSKLLGPKDEKNATQPVKVWQLKRPKTYGVKLV